MERLQLAELSDLKRALPGSVVTVGVFDGVHLGHQSILDRLTAASRRRGLPAVCVTFSIHPKAVLLGEAPRQILSLDHRLDLLERAGVNIALVVEFSARFAAVEAEAFVEQLLVRGLSVRELIIGHDTAIGCQRRGDAAFLAEAGLRFGFEVVSMGEVLVDGSVVSSTAVRRAISAGELIAARRMLGRPVTLRGRVVTGDGRGATLGFPTANLEVLSEAFPPLGVYAVTARTPGQPGLPAVMNYGLRPTFQQDEAHAVFEIHVIDRDDLDLYGQTMEVQLHASLRREQRFDGAQALKAQIALDIAAARKALALLAAANDNPPQG